MQKVVIPVNRKFGKYEVVERLGRGGMAEVYRAYHASLDRYVAIKVLHTFLADAPEFRTRFEREARHVARLKHPNIVQVYDFDFDDASDSYYMVMELVEGATLKDRLADLAQRDERFTLKDTLKLMKQAASALAYAHKEGMLHRDVKPANLMLDKDNRLVLTDFGIAKMVSNPTLTATGGMVGTPAYMSPEQGMGDLGDERSDLYALGVIWYEMLTGQVPYNAETPLALILKHVNERIPSLRAVRPDLPVEADEILRKLLAKNPDERYQRAEDVIADLEQLENLLARGDEDAFSTPIPPTTTSQRDEVPTPSTPVYLRTLRQTTPPDAIIKAKSTRQEPPPKRPSAIVLTLLLLLFIGIISIASFVIGASNGWFSAFAQAKPTPTDVMLIVELTEDYSPTPEPTFTATATPTFTNEPITTPTRATVTPAPSHTSQPSATPTIVFTPSPTPNMTQTLSAQQTATTSACIFDYAIVEQTPEDGQAGGFFTTNSSYKREIVLLNTGTCLWEPNASLTFIEGESFSAGPRIFIRQAVNVGDEITLTFEGTLPPRGSLDPITGIWQLRTRGQLPIGDLLPISVMVFDPGSN